MPANLETQQGPQDSKRSVFIPIPWKAMPKNAQITAQLNSSHTLVKQCSKFSKPGFNSIWIGNSKMFKMNLQKPEEPEIKLPASIGSLKKRVPDKHLLLLYWLDQTLWLCGSQQLWKILRELGIPDYLTCLLRNLYAGQEAKVRMDMEQQNGSK